MSHTRFRIQTLEARAALPFTALPQLQPPVFPLLCGTSTKTHDLHAISFLYHSPCVPPMSQTRRLTCKQSHGIERLFLSLFGGANIMRHRCSLIHGSPPATPSIYISGAFLDSSFCSALSIVSGLYCRRTQLGPQLAACAPGLSRAPSLLTVFTVVAILI